MGWRRMGKVFVKLATLYNLQLPAFASVALVQQWMALKMKPLILRMLRRLMFIALIMHYKWLSQVNHTVKYDLEMCKSVLYSQLLNTTVQDTCIWAY